MSRVPVKTSPVFITLPTPLADDVRDGIDCRMGLRGFAMPEDAIDAIDLARELERDCMTMALRLTCQDGNTFGPEVAEAMERWQPRVDALLADPETYK